jgi:hypothetical protein
MSKSSKNLVWDISGIDKTGLIWNNFIIKYVFFYYY